MVQALELQLHNQPDSLMQILVQIQISGFKGSSGTVPLAHHHSLASLSSLSLHSPIGLSSLLLLFNLATIFFHVI
jgi:hypothetical protein